MTIRSAEPLVEENEEDLGEVLDEEEQILHAVINCHHVAVEDSKGVLYGLF